MVCPGATLGIRLRNVEKTTGEIHLRHHVSPEGVYRGRKVIDKGADE